MRVLHRLSVPVLALFVCLLLYYTGVIETLSGNCLDLLYHLRGTREPSQQIVIVGIDEPSIDALGGWPFPREIHATMLAQLASAKAIGFDVLFNESNAGDAQLSNAFAAGPPVVLAAAMGYDQVVLRPAPTLSGYAGAGHIITLLGSDGVVRKVLPYLHVDLPVFSLAMLSAAAEEHTFSMTSAPLLLNFYGPEFTYIYISYLDVLQGAVAADFFQDRYVLIGSQALGLGDVHITPFSRKYPTPGVEVQATVLNNFLDSSFLKSVPRMSWTISLALILLSLLVWPYMSAGRNLALTLLLVVLLCGIVTTLFYANIFLDPVVPLILLFSSYLIFLISQVMSTARQLFREVNELHGQLKTSLAYTYVNIPAPFLQNSEERVSDKRFIGEMGRYLFRMRQGIQALNLQNRFIHHLLSEETPPLILWDQDKGEVVLASTQFQRLWQDIGRSDEQLPLLREFQELVNHNRLDQESATVPAQLPAKQMVDIALVAKGKKHYFQVILQPVLTGDTAFCGVLAILADVTELRELERVKGEVVSVVSHELKLPLTTILGYGEMLADSLDGEQKQYAEEICSQTQRLNRMIEGFLDIARIESGKYTFRQFPFDVLSVIQEGILAVSYAAEQKQVNLQADMPRKTTPMLGDESMLLQVIINLLDNAVKFSPVGTTVMIDLKEQEDCFCAQISDEGPGIPQSLQEQVFAKFHRGAHDGTEEGFGLGLNLVQQVVMAHDGTITLESYAPQGARFRLVLPKKVIS